jgi:hypothetical protein
VALEIISRDELEIIEERLDEEERLRLAAREKDEDETEAYVSRQIARVEERQQAEVSRIEAINAAWVNFLDSNRLIFGTIESGWNTLWQSISDTAMTGSDRVKAIWGSMKAAFFTTIGDMLKEEILVAGKSLFVHSQAETAKTAITQQGIAARLAVSVAGFAKEIAMVVKSIGIFLAQAAAKLVAWFASLGPIGLVAGLASIPALIAGARALIKSVGVFAEGGIATRPTLGLFAEAGAPEAAIPLNERGAAFMAQLLPRLAPVNAQASGDFNQLAKAMAMEIRKIKIEIHSELNSLQFFRKEFTRFEKIRGDNMI